MDVAGQDDLLLAGRAGDRAGAGVVLAGLGIGVAIVVVAELGEHPGAEDDPSPGWLREDLSVRVPAKMSLDLPCRS